MITFVMMFCFPVLGLVVSLYSIRKSFKNWKTYIFFLALFCATVAYSYTPVKNNSDIIRYFEWAETLGKLSLSEAFSYQIRGESKLYFLNILLWAGGKLGDVHIIPAVSVFIVYYICFYITCDAAYKNNIPSKYGFFYIVFSLLTLNFYAITNNIRNVLGFCIVGMAVYRDLLQKKRNIKTWLLYILPLFLHPSVLVLVLLRLFLLIPGNYKILLLLLVSQVMKITELLYGILFNVSSNNLIISLVKNMVIKAYWYYRNHEGEWAIAVANSGSQQLAKIIYISLAIVICIVIYLYQSRKKTVDKKHFVESGLKKYTDYVFYIGIITIACAPMPMPEYWRFASILIALAGPIMVLVFESKKAIYSLLGKSVFIFTPVACALWVRELLKCELFELFIYPFFMNPFVILIKNLLN